MTTRGRKQKPGRITFVGSGPGDPGLLTTRARTVLVNARLIFTDPDVPEAVLALALVTGMTIEWIERRALLRLDHKTVLSLTTFART